MRGRGHWTAMMLSVACALASAVAVHAADRRGPDGAQAGEGALRMHALFQDHAVLQRDAPIRVWGQATPGAEVAVSLGGAGAMARAAADGRWEATLPAMAAGGPHVLSASSGGSTRAARDVLVGDVWLCSGQSNMELPVWRSLDARGEIDGAAGDGIRLLTVPQAGHALPQATFATDTAWTAVTPDTLRDFSAACFYFARELRKTVDVPLGLVNAAWGGSRIEAWTSGDALRRAGGSDAVLDVLALYARDPVAGAARWGALWAGWWRDAGQHGAPWETDDDAAGDGWQPVPALVPWERWGVPAMAGYDGMVWYRRTLTLDAAQAAQGATLLLGPADEMDTTWVNGVGVGSSYGAGDGREYPLPPGLLRAGDNTVVVNVLDTYREGGLRGDAAQYALRLRDGTRLPLADGWRWRADAGATPPRAPWQTAAGVSTLHNAMIAPLDGLRLKGALWYQGESNTGEADAYAAQLRLLRADWRRRFGDGLAMLVVQLANYGAPATAPTESGWAALREAQRQVADDDPRTALAVAIDIGDRDDIHPPNKQALGRRLARAARHAAYGEALPAAGPVPLAATREGDAVRVRFGDVTGALVALGAPGPIGFELCCAEDGSCRYADATLDGDAVLLRGADGAPAAARATRVRHAWADSPVVTLFDGAGLPAGPFELPIR